MGTGEGEENQQLNNEGKCIYEDQEEKGTGRGC